MRDVIDDLRVFDPTDEAAQLQSVLRLVSTGASVVDLGAGGGRIARPLAESGRSVLAVDHSNDALALNSWSERDGIEPLHEDFLAPSSTWQSRGPFEVALCLGNTAALVLEHETMRALFERVSRSLRPDGVSSLMTSRSEPSHSPSYPFIARGEYYMRDFALFR